MSRTLTGCKRCRESHQKCVVTPPNKDCQRCINAEAECIFEPRTRFKSVSHVPLKGAGRGRGNARFNLSYSRRQKWVDIPRSLNFVSETGDSDLDSNTEDLDDDMDFDDSHEANDDQFSFHGGNRTPLDGDQGDLPPISFGDQDNNATSRSPMRSAFTSQTNAAPPRSNPVQLSSQGETQSIAHEIATQDPITYTSPFSGSAFSYQGSAGSPGQPQGTPHMSTSSDNDNTSTGHSYPSLLLSKREAYLMRNFVNTVSTWLDACDSTRQFATTVPHRAFQSPILLYAVLASSSQHQAQIRKAKDDTESIGYYDECLHRLIPALSRQDEAIDETLLSAVTILRMVEEYSADDTRCHLLGTTRLLNSISSFASSGGLGEACAWLSLRQNSYVAFVNQEPLVPFLNNYEKSTVFHNQDEGSWANRIVFLFAKALGLAFGSETPNSGLSWQSLKDETEDWLQKKPYAFTPTWIEPIDYEAKRAFPQPWLLSDAQVVALQHYHLTKIMIAAFTPAPQLNGFNALFQKSNAEEQVIYNLRLVVGIAQANKAAHLIGFFSASHALSVCGFMLRHELEHEECAALLKEMSERIGWRTSLRRLEKQWGRNSSVSAVGESN